jgi:hypothetical protein
LSFNRLDKKKFNTGDGCAMNITIRSANQGDLLSILRIYNQGIEDRIATLETELKEIAFMREWFEKHQGRYQVILAELQNHIVGWASLNPYNPRDAYKGVAELGQGLYRIKGYREVGVFKHQGILDNKFVDVMAMEKLLLMEE